MAELTRRYIVMQMAAEGPFDIADPEGAFVLKPWKDPAALRALIAYSEHCYAELAQELDQWVRAIVAGPKIRGGVGSRNELTAPARRKAAIAAKPKAKSKAKRSKHRKKKAKRRA
ncbi:MAG TPA: hypothetical protein VGV06_08725 [Methylomirabilota bacterium]|nr:hypothetical protein [Methylomirabilota bacterium]